MGKMFEYLGKAMTFAEKAAAVAVGEFQEMKSIIVKKEITDVDILNSKINTLELEKAVFEERCNTALHKAEDASNAVEKLPKLEEKLLSCHAAFLLEYPERVCKGHQDSIGPCSICHDQTEHQKSCLCVNCFRFLKIKKEGAC